MQVIPRTPTRHPSAWTGAQLRPRSDWVERLGEADIADLDRAR